MEKHIVLDNKTLFSINWLWTAKMLVGPLMKFTKKGLNNYVFSVMSVAIEAWHWILAVPVCNLLAGHYQCDYLSIECVFTACHGGSSCMCPGASQPYTASTLLSHCDPLCRPSVHHHVKPLTSVVTYWFCLLLTPWFLTLFPKKSYQLFSIGKREKIIWI